MYLDRTSDQNAAHYMHAHTNINAANTYINVYITMYILLLCSRESHAQDVMKTLLEAGADVNLANFYGETPLYAAAYWGHGDVINHLLATVCVHACVVCVRCWVCALCVHCVCIAWGCCTFVYVNFTARFVTVAMSSITFWQWHVCMRVCLWNVRVRL